jgi:hypothetical protein
MSNSGPTNQHPLDLGAKFKRENEALKAQLKQTQQALEFTQEAHKKLRDEHQVMRAQREQLLGAFETALESWIASIYEHYHGTLEFDEQMEPTQRMQNLLAQYKNNQ